MTRLHLRTRACRVAIAAGAAALAGALAAGPAAAQPRDATLDSMPREIVPAETLATFPPGTFLENKSQVLAANGLLRIVPHLNFQGIATIERRSYTEVGDENVTSLHPELVWDWRTWRVSTGIAHYSRTNGTVYRDTTWLLKITKQFL